VDHAPEPAPAAATVATVAGHEPTPAEVAEVDALYALMDKLKSPEPPARP
jgi:hypothetical protein